MKKIDSLLIHGGGCVCETTGAVNYPIYQTSTFEQDGLGRHKGYEYSRTKNPTRSALERLIAELEDAGASGENGENGAECGGGNGENDGKIGAEIGGNFAQNYVKNGENLAQNGENGGENPAHAAPNSNLDAPAQGFAFASGMAATSAVLAMFSAGDEIVISNNVYGGTFRVLDKVFARFGLRYHICDMRDAAALRGLLAARNGGDFGNEIGGEIDNKNHAQTTPNSNLDVGGGENGGENYGANNNGKNFGENGGKNGGENFTKTPAQNPTTNPATPPRRRIKALFLETPANPLMSVTDIAQTARIAHEFGALLIVDNTFMTPYLQRPLAFGADIVVHSATKYLGGHSDLVAGCAVAKDPALCERIGFLQNAMGAVLAPFDSFLLIRGIKTLGLRMRRHSENALAVAKFLAAHEAVERVFHPLLCEESGASGENGANGANDGRGESGASGATMAGKINAPAAKTAAQIHTAQADGGGGMVSFELREGWDLARFVGGCRLIALAESLGGVESLLCHPATMTHASIPPAIRAQMGISERLVRLSMGIEDAGDLLADLDQALRAAKI